MTKKTPMYNVTFKDIENYIQKGYEKGRKETIERASQLSMAVPIMVLRDEFGFGEKRIDKFIACLLYTSDAADDAPRV